MQEGFPTAAVRGAALLEGSKSLGPPQGGGDMGLAEGGSSYLECAQQLQQSLPAADVLGAALQAAFDDGKQVGGGVQHARLLRVLHGRPRLLSDHAVQLLTQRPLFRFDVHPAPISSNHTLKRSISSHTR